MSLRERIRKVFRYGDASVEEVLVAAGRLGCPVSLSYVDRDRILRNLNCHVSSIRKNRVMLKLDDPQPASGFNQEKCYIYFKLPNAAMERLNFARDPKQNGFLCKSSIVECFPDGQDMARKLALAMPRDYIRRELRSHERYRVFSGMLADAALWIMDGAQGGQFVAREPDFTCNPEMPSSLRIVNISAGGARVVIEKTDYLEELANVDQKTFLLRLGLTIVPGEVLDTYIICGCVGSNYSIGQRRFTLRLRFLLNRNSQGRQTRQETARNEIGQWLENKFNTDKE